MIRFRCPDCGREYVLIDAFAHLPLLCKGCGRQLIVPDPQPEPVVVPPPKVPAAPVSKPIPPPGLPKVERPPAATDGDRAGEDRVPATWKRPDDLHVPPDAAEKPDISLKMTGPAPPTTPHSSPTVTPEKATPPEPQSTPERSRRRVAQLVDAVAVLILTGLGVMVGEVAVRKSTREILSAAGSATKFPPTDLLIWLGCAAFFVLGYVWLGTRGRTLGGWLKRRAR
ncbi:MAG: hypothetical protein JWO38_4475 [Gemmataceae bacterium]|nr:hypothetical protein [Gemmataceae bacterium]